MHGNLMNVGADAASGHHSMQMAEVSDTYVVAAVDSALLSQVYVSTR